MTKISSLSLIDDLQGDETIPTVQAGATRRAPLDLLVNPELDTVVSLANARAREALGKGSGDSHLGEFAGGLIPSAQTVKEAIQSLEMDNLTRMRIADLADPDQGAGLVSISHEANYPLGSSGRKLQTYVSPYDHPFNATGGPNDTAAVQAAVT